VPVVKSPFAPPETKGSATKDIAAMIPGLLAPFVEVSDKAKVAHGVTSFMMALSANNDKLKELNRTHRWWEPPPSACWDTVLPESYSKDVWTIVPHEVVLAAHDFTLLDSTDTVHYVKCKMANREVWYSMETKTFTIYTAMCRSEHARDVISAYYLSKGLDRHKETWASLDANEAITAIDPPNISQDVAGERTKQFIAELTAYRKAGISRSYLFEGPPGSGKSTMIRHMARALNTSVLVVPSSLSLNSRHLDLVEVGVIILDDIDRADERAYPRLILLLEDFAARGIIVLASANHLGGIPDACMRPGRFDEIETVEGADPAVIAEVLKDYPELIPLAQGFTLAFISDMQKKARVLGVPAVISSLNNYRKRSSLSQNRPFVPPKEEDDSDAWCAGISLTAETTTKLTTLVGAETTAKVAELVGDSPATYEEYFMDSTGGIARKK